MSFSLKKVSYLLCGIIFNFVCVCIQFIYVSVCSHLKTIDLIGFCVALLLCCLL